MVAKGRVIRPFNPRSYGSRPSLSLLQSALSVSVRKDYFAWDHQNLLIPFETRAYSPVRNIFFRLRNWPKTFFGFCLRGGK